MANLSDDLIHGAAAAADYMGLNRRTVYRMVEAGEIPFIRKGNKIFFRKSDLDVAFQAQSQRAEDQAEASLRAEKSHILRAQFKRRSALASQFLSTAVSLEFPSSENIPAEQLYERSAHTAFWLADAFLEVEEAEYSKVRASIEQCFASEADTSGKPT